MYEIFDYLMKMHNKTAYRISKDTGIAYSTLADWKKGRSTPKQDKLQIIADYFEVTFDYLMGTEKNENVQYYLNDETREIAQEIFENKDLRILFDASRKAKPEDLKFIVEMAKRFKGEE